MKNLTPKDQVVVHINHPPACPEKERQENGGLTDREVVRFSSYLPEMEEPPSMPEQIFSHEAFTRAIFRAHGATPHNDPNFEKGWIGLTRLGR